MQIFPKTKGFSNKRGLSRKNSLFSLKTTFAFLEKNSNPEYWVLEKNPILGQYRDPCFLHSCMITLRPNYRKVEATRVHLVGVDTWAPEVHKS